MLEEEEKDGEDKVSKRKLKKLSRFVFHPKKSMNKRLRQVKIKQKSQLNNLSQKCTLKVFVHLLNRSALYAQLRLILNRCSRSFKFFLSIYLG